MKLQLQRKGKPGRLNTYVLADAYPAEEITIKAGSLTEAKEHLAELQAANHTGSYEPIVTTIEGHTTITYRTPITYHDGTDKQIGQLWSTQRLESTGQLGRGSSMDWHHHRSQAVTDAAASLANVTQDPMDEAQEARIIARLHEIDPTGRAAQKHADYCKHYRRWIAEEREAGRMEEDPHRPGHYRPAPAPAAA